MLSESSQQSCRSLGTPDKIGALSGAGREIPADSRPMRQPSCSLPRRAVAASDLHRRTALDARGDRPARVAARATRPKRCRTSSTDSAALRHRRLLRVPARARPRESGPRGDRRPPPGKRRPHPDAVVRRPRRARRRAARAPMRRRRGHASALQVLPRGRRGRINRSSACRWSIAGCCRACWWSRPPSRAASPTKTSGCS